MDGQERPAFRGYASGILRLHASGAVLAAFVASAAVAGPSDYVFLPAVAYGEREIDFKYGAAGKKDEPSEQAASLGFGYGATTTSAEGRPSCGTPRSSSA